MEKLVENSQFSTYSINKLKVSKTNEVENSFEDITKILPDVSKRGGRNCFLINLEFDNTFASSFLCYWPPSTADNLVSLDITSK